MSRRRDWNINTADCFQVWSRGGWLEIFAHKKAAVTVCRAALVNSSPGKGEEAGVEVRSTAPE